MTASRLLALAWALSALLIAPAWLSAVEPVAPTPTPAQEAPPAGAEPAPAPEAEDADGAPDSVQPQAEVVASEGDEELPAAEPEPKPQEEVKQAKEPKATAAASTSVTIKDFDFSPASVTVNVGDTVTWTNAGPTGHSATASDGSFDTGIMPKGQSGSHTFSEAGTIAYICTPHPFMKGTVVVKGETASSDDEGSTGGSGPPADGGSAPTTATDADTSGLPATGAETLLIALSGLAALASGLLLRRRAEG